MIVLKRQGERFVGWIDVRLRRSLDEFSPQFSLTYTDRWDPERDPWPLVPGEEVEILWNEHTLITGFINESRYNVRGDRWVLRTSGRGTTCDLVDCAAVHKTGQWRGRRLSEIVLDLVRPFGIDVRIASEDDKKFRRFELEDGETVFDTVDRLCKVRGFLPVTRPDGSLEIWNTDRVTRVVDLDLSAAIGRNRTDSEQDRFSEYLVRGQAHATPEFHGDNAVAQSGSIKDPSVKRYRPLIVSAETPADKKVLETRALWERNRRAGKSERYGVDLADILAPDGKPWEPGMQVRVRDQQLGVDSQLLLAGMSLSVDDRSFRVNLELVRPEAYTQLEYPERGTLWQ